MRIITLVENSCGNEKCIAEHGLSIYIETKKHRLLADAGQTDAVVKNADVLGVDLSLVDTLFLSHGHYDHSGGIIPFCKINDKADIYMQKSAAEPHFNSKRYNGIDRDILKLPNLHLLSGSHKIDDELFIFSDIRGRRCFPEGNKSLFKEENGQRVCDDFAHEQCLVVNSEGKSILISGCAHNGILNILDRFTELFGKHPDYVISGFHMMKREGNYTDDDKNLIIQTAEELKTLDTVFFSGHCTGDVPFQLMKSIMGDKLTALHSGEDVRL